MPSQHRDRPRSRPERENGPDVRRRAALARLGLTALAVYAAPTILHLEREAHAVQPSRCKGKGQGRGTPWCKGGGYDAARRRVYGSHGYAAGSAGPRRDPRDR